MPLLSHDELGTFVDESGDLSLKDPNNSVFVLGASIKAEPDQPLIEERWRVLRKMVHGNGNLPLHMREHSHKIRDKVQEYLLEFFYKTPFARIAVSYKNNIIMESPDDILKKTFYELLNLHAIASAHNPLLKQALIFESSDLKSKIEKNCRGLRLLTNGQPTPLRFLYLTKKQMEPWGEIADCIAHTVAGACRSASPPNFLLQRYQAIFNPLMNTVPAIHHTFEIATVPANIIK